MRYNYILKQRTLAVGSHLYVELSRHDSGSDRVGYYVRVERLEVPGLVGKVGESSLSEGEDSKRHEPDGQRELLLYVFVVVEPARRPVVLGLVPANDDGRFEPQNASRQPRAKLGTISCCKLWIQKH